MPARLPEFERPPVAEVAISIQFDSPVLDGPLVMLRWSEVRHRFPKYELAPPLPRIIERFDARQVPEFEIQFSDTPITPQLLMMTESGEEALQLQENRIGYTWRKLNPGGGYPNYSLLKERFRQELEDFRAYIDENGLGEFSPVQCELTYVDALLPQPGVWEGHSDLGKVIPSAATRLTEGFLTSPESTTYTIRYIISGNGAPPGRLHIILEPRFLQPELSPMYLMTSTARGAPQGNGTPEIFNTLDIWHEWILRAFVDLTSSEMHRAWGRTA